MDVLVNNAGRGQGGVDGQQPGDPARAAAAIIAALHDDQTPLRLPLGNDAVDGVLAHLDSVRTGIRAWEMISRSTDFVAST